VHPKRASRRKMITQLHSFVIDASRILQIVGQCGTVRWLIGESCDTAMERDNAILLISARTSICVLLRCVFRESKIYRFIGTLVGNDLSLARIDIEYVMKLLILPAAVCISHASKTIFPRDEFTGLDLSSASFSLLLFLSLTLFPLVRGDSGLIACARDLRDAWVQIIIRE